MQELATGIDATAATTRRHAGTPDTKPLTIPIAPATVAAPFPALRLREDLAPLAVAMRAAVRSGWQRLTPANRLLLGGVAVLALLLLALSLLLIGGGEPGGTPMVQPTCLRRSTRICNSCMRR